MIATQSMLLVAARRALSREINQPDWTIHEKEHYLNQLDLYNAGQELLRAGVDSDDKDLVEKSRAHQLRYAASPRIESHVHLIAPELVKPAELELCEFPCELTGATNERLWELGVACVLGTSGKATHFVQGVGCPLLLKQALGVTADDRFASIFSKEHGCGLVFELASIPAPKRLDLWRMITRNFDPNEKVPCFASSVLGQPDLGSVDVVCTDGELCLAVSGDGLRARLVHVGNLVQPIKDDAAGLGQMVEKAKEKRNRMTETVDASKWL